MRVDTIAAIATAMSNSGIGIIRISGEDAVKTADKVIKIKDCLTVRLIRFTTVLLWMAIRK